MRRLKSLDTIREELRTGKARVFVNGVLVNPPKVVADTGQDTTRDQPIGEPDQPTAAELDAAFPGWRDRELAAEAERILSLTDEQVEQEVRDRGEDPGEVAVRMRRLIAEALEQSK